MNRSRSLAFALVIVFSQCIAVAPAVAEISPRAEGGDDLSQAAYFRTALIHQWNLHRDYETPAALLKAAVMAQEGRKKEEIIAAVTKFRSEHARNVGTGLRREWQVNEDYRRMIRHVGGLAGAVIEKYSPIPAGGKFGDIVADIGIMSYERLFRDKKVIDASKRIGAAYNNVLRAESEIASLVIAAWKHSVFRDVYTEQFESVLRIRPTDSIAQISRRVPILALQGSVATVLESLSEDTVETQQKIATLQGEVAETLKELRNQTQAAAAPGKAEVTEIREQLQREGLRAGVFLATTAIGLIDPSAGRETQAISSAAFQIHDAIRDFKATIGVAKDLTGTASLVMTANFVGAALTLVSAFETTGPSPEEVILEEIVKLRKDIRDVRTEMHDRFGVVERRLATVYTRLNQGFVELDQQLRQQSRVLSVIISRLESVERQVGASTSIVVRRTEFLEALIKDLRVRGCIDWKKTLHTRLSQRQYGECLTDLQSLFSLELLDKDQMEWADVYSSGSLSEHLRKSPNELATASLQNLARLSQVKYLPRKVPGPSDWRDGATKYLNFLEQWPDFRGQVRREGFKYEELKEGAKMVGALVDVARHELDEFSSGREGTAVGKLLARVEGREAVLVGALEKYKNEYNKTVLRREGVRAVGSVQITPVVDKARCGFHTGAEVRNFEGKGYVVDLLPGVDGIVPMFVRQLVHAGLGRTEYCMELYYHRRWRKKSSLDSGQEDILTARVVPNMRRSGRLWADDGGIPHYQDPGPYTAVLRVDYVLDADDCGRSGARRGGLAILELSARDLKKIAGGQRYFGSDVPESRLAAPKGIWDREWRDRFLREASVKQYHDVIQCLETQLTGRLQARWMVMEREMSEWITDKLLGDEALKAADKKTEIDYALLSHWLWSGYADAVPKDELLGNLIDGTASGPTLAFVLEQSLFHQELLVWKTPDQYTQGLKDFRELLQSEQMREALRRIEDNFGVKRLLSRIERVR